MPAFVDTNVAVYALGRDSDKRARAKQILDDAPIASSQVINEAISVLMGKQRFAREEAYEVADAVMKLVAVAPVTANTVRDAMTVGLRYGLSHWDSLMWLPRSPQAATRCIPRTCRMGKSSRAG